MRTPWALPLQPVPPAPGSPGQWPHQPCCAHLPHPHLHMMLALWALRKPRDPNFPVFSCALFWTVGTRRVTPLFLPSGVRGYFCFDGMAMFSMGSR